MGKRVYTTTEYGSFLSEKHIDGYVTLPDRTFQQLRQFVLSDQSSQLLGLTGKGSLGEVITVKNYVGIIALPDGAVIQILPKIYSAVQDDKAHSKSKKLLLQMLKTLREAPNHTLPPAQVDIVNMDILEIFIRMFLDELLLLVQRGSKCGYENVQENLNLVKGKLLFSQQLRKNFAHQERCYVAYDAFTINRPENRLIRSTLLILERKSVNEKNRRDIRMLLQTMEQVDRSRSIERDFAQCVSDRSMKDYRNILRWCRIFLTNHSFTSFTGQERAFALLYPMEKLFESYIAAQLKRSMGEEKYQITAQDRSCWLFESPNQFQLRPDVVVRRRMDGAVFVLDTKWKLLDKTQRNLGISQADMYQMYAYQKKYGAETVTLLYPKTEWVDTDEPLEFHGEDGVHVLVRFVDLFCVQESIKELQKLMEER